MDEPLLIVEEEEEYSPIARLIELGRQKSYVTLDDILHFFPEAEQDVEQLEEAFAADDFARLALTAPDRTLSMHRVSPDVNRVAIDAERLVHPLVGAMDQPDFFGDLLG